MLQPKWTYYEGTHRKGFGKDVGATYDDDFIGPECSRIQKGKEKLLGLLYDDLVRKRGAKGSSF